MFKAATPLPHRFELRTTNAALSVEVIWSDGLQAGVRFVSP